jgi:NAD(P)-dependent dehydrogenase (short-subunit alcohol dehydrogenase family)
VALTTDTDHEARLRILDVDLNSVFLCTNRELRVMAGQGSGSILNMASPEQPRSSSRHRESA